MSFGISRGRERLSAMGVQWRSLMASDHTVQITTTMPSGRSKLRAEQDVSAFDRGDSSKALTISHEVSVDGGQTWTPWGSGTTTGSASRPADLPLYFEVPAPPAGALVRTTIRAGANGVEGGAIVRAR